MLKKVEIGSVHDDVYGQIRTYIIERGLEPGDKLPSENELAAALKVSRPAIREALRGLEAVGIIDVQRGRGRFIREFDFEVISDGLAYSLVFDVTSLRDLLEVRRALESSFLPQAMQALTPDVLRELEGLIKAMEGKQTSGQPFIEEDMGFHRVLFREVDNRVLRQLLEVFWRMFRYVHAKGLLNPGEEGKTVAYHRSLHEALQKGSIQRAQELLQAHFDDVAKRIDELEQQGGTDSKIPAAVKSPSKKKGDHHA